MSDFAFFAPCDVLGGTPGLATDYQQHLGAAGRPLVQACTACRHVQFPPTLRCPRCTSAELAWADGGTTGVVRTFVTVRAEEPTPYYSVPGKLAERTPYTTLFVELDQHPGVRVTALLAEGETPPATGESPAVTLSISTASRPIVIASIV